MIFGVWQAGAIIYYHPQWRKWIGLRAIGGTECMARRALDVHDNIDGTLVSPSLYLPLALSLCLVALCVVSVDEAPLAGRQSIALRTTVQE